MLIYYTKIFFRNFKKNKFYYFLNLASIVIGLFISSFLFSYLHQQFLFEKFSSKSERIYKLNIGNYGVTPLGFKGLLNDVTSIEELIRFSKRSLQLKNKDISIGNVYYTDGNILEAFDFNMIVGNRSNALRNPFSIVLTESIAKKLYGDINILGNYIIDVDNNEYKITGIIKDITHSHLQINAIVPNNTLKSIFKNPSILEDVGDWSNLTYVLLRQNTDIVGVENSINNLLDNYKLEISGQKASFFLQSLYEVYFSQELNLYDGCRHGNKNAIIGCILVLIVISSLVILNNVNITFVILNSRTKEREVNKILGAFKLNFLKQTFIEVTLLFIISFTVIVLSLRLYFTYIQNFLNWRLFDNISFQELLQAGLIYSFILGFISYLFLTFDIICNSGYSKKNGLNIKRNLNNLGLFIQFTAIGVLISFILNVGSQINYVQTQYKGFNSKNILCLKFNSDYSFDANILRDKLQKQSCVQSVSYSNSLLFDNIPKRFLDINEKEEICYCLEVGSGFFNTLDIHIKEGRNFKDVGSENECLVNESFIKKFEITNPINSFIGEMKIIGVIKDFNFETLHKDIKPLMFINTRNNKFFYIKYTDNKNILNVIDKTSRSNINDISYEYYFLDDIIKSSYDVENKLKENLNIYMLIIIIIAAIGLLAVILFDVTNKFKEIAIRRFFGAKIVDVLLIILKSYYKTISLSIISSTFLSYFLYRKWIQNFYYNVDINYSNYLYAALFIILFILLVIIFVLLNYASKRTIMKQLRYE